MVPYQARFRYAYNPENIYDPYCNPDVAAAKHPLPSNAPDCNFAPTLNIFSVLAGFESTPLVSLQRSNFSVPRTIPQWRRKRGKLCYKSTEEGTECVKWHQASAGLALEHASSPKTENQRDAHHSQRSASISSHFVSHTFYWLKILQMGPVLPRRISTNTRTNLKASNGMVILAFNHGGTSNIPAASINLPKSTFNPRIPALTIEALSKRSSNVVPWPTSVCTQKTVIDHAFACVVKDAVPGILTNSSSSSGKRDWYGESSYQDVSTPRTCQNCSFPRLCRTAQISDTTVTPHHEGLANSAFVDRQFTANWPKCDDFITYKSPVPLLEPLTPFYPYQPGNLYRASRAARPAYFCCTLTNLALMDSLNWSRPTSTDAFPICHRQNCKARSEPCISSSHPSGYSTWEIDNIRGLRLGTILTPVSMINGYRKSSHAQQVDSIFANRNPRVRRRLYSGPTRFARYPWLENGFATPPNGLASVSIYPLREQPHTTSEDLVEDIEPSKEGVYLSSQYKRHSCLFILSDIRHRRASTSTDSVIPLRDSVPVIIEESDHSAESNMEPYGVEITENIDDDFDIESTEEYEVVQPNADDGSLEEWEIVSTLLAEEDLSRVGQ